MKAKKVTSIEVEAAYHKWVDTPIGKYTHYTAKHIIGQIDAGLERYMNQGFTKISFDVYPREIKKSEYEIIRKEFEERGFDVMLEYNRHVVVSVWGPLGDGMMRRVAR